MALVLADRVKETSVTTGTGTFTLDGAVNGYQTFAAAIGSGNTCYYTIAGQVSSDWEVGIGTVGSGTLTRTTVLSSSNGGSLVNFIAGTKDVFVTYPAEKSVYRDSSGDTVQNSFSSITSGSIALTTGTISTTPSASTDIVNKTYVDGLVAAGVNYHTPVRLESPNTAGNLNATYNNGTAGVGATLTNAGTQVALTIDGVATVVGDRVLIYNQTNAAENGVYTVTNIGSGSTNWVLTRSTDTNTYGPGPNALDEGSAFYVTAGNTGAGETYVCSTVGTITFGTTAITFAQISSAQIYSAGTGLTLTNTTFSLSNTAVTAGSYGSASNVPNYTVNAQGQLTAAANTPIAISYTAVSGLAASATTDTTDATNITSGTLPTGRLSGSYTGITGVGTIAAGTWQGSAIGVAYGGTGFTGYTTGDLIYASGASTLAKLAAGTNGYVLTMAGGVPSWAANSAVTTFSAGTTGLTPSTATSGAVTLAGTLVVSNGGTGLTSVTANRIPYGNGTGALQTSANLTFNGTTLTNTGNAVISDNSTSAALRITQVGTGNALEVEDSANPDGTPFIIDASGNVGVGVTPAFSGVKLTLAGGGSDAQQWNFRYSNDTSGYQTQYIKSRGTSLFSPAIVTSGDQIGLMNFTAWDSAAYTSAATITVAVDGTPGANDMPGRLVFSTTADGASSPTEAMRIDSARRVGIGGAATTGEMVAIRNTAETTATVFGLRNLASINQATTTTAYGISDQTQILSPAALTNLFRFRAASGGFTGTVTNQYGYAADSTLTGATNNYGFHSNIASGTGRWNFYAAGTADNYFAGKVGIGTTTPTSALTVEGLTEVRSGNYLMLRPSGNSWDMRLQAVSTRLDFYSGGDLVNPIVSMLNGGNVGIGISSPVSKLDVYAASGYVDARVRSGSNQTYVATDGSASYFGTYSNIPIIFSTNNINRGGISAAGVWSLGNAAGAESLRVTPTTSSVNYIDIAGATTTNDPTITAAGSDTNIDIQLVPKGTGSTYSPTFAASNGLVMNNATISTSYTLPTGYNAVSAGPITVASGVVVTVPSGSTWVVV